MLTISNTTEGYLKNVEIKGNTVQNPTNLSDIKSVGKKLENQDLYEIPLLSCGKNMWEFGNITAPNSKWGLDVYKLKFKPNTQYTLRGFHKCVASGGNPSIVFQYTDGTYDGGNRASSTEKEFVLTSTRGKSVSHIRYNYTSNTISDTYYVRDIQLEEGTTATPYEQFQSNKITILSPVQLEKVGDISDIIIEKNGVWGVEKNIITTIFKGTETNLQHSYTFENFFRFRTNTNNYGKPIGAISDKFKYLALPNGVEEGVSISNTNNVEFVISKNNVSTPSVDDFKKWLSSNNTMVKCIALNPTFIPLPHDQQILLKTFDNKTNISFLTEIEGTIKAQVPKSIKATVNTHTSQIENIYDELGRVKRLEESTVSTVTTDKDFANVQATSNGYFEDVKLSGKTLVNIAPYKDMYFEKTEQSGYKFKEFIVPLAKRNTEYTICVNVTQNPSTQNRSFFTFINDVGVGTPNGYNYTFIGTGLHVFKLKTLDADFPKGVKFRFASNNNGENGVYECTNLVMLEGDYTQNPPSYFEGLKSVGDGVDELVVSSVKGDGNLIDVCEKYTNKPHELDNLTKLERNTIYRAKVFTDNNDITGITFGTSYNIRAYYSDGTFDNIIPGKDFVLNDNKEFKRLWINFSDAQFSNLKGTAKWFSIQLTKQIEYSKYISHKADKKRILYYDTTDSTWKKPTLREWDTIEKHSDGKYYYHQRSPQLVLNGSENFGIIQNPSESNCMRFYLVNTAPIGLSGSFKSISNIFKGGSSGTSTEECIGIDGNGKIVISILKSKLETPDVDGFKKWLQANNVTVVYQLAQEKVFECTNIDLITYQNETNYVFNGGAISPRTSLKVQNNIGNVVSLLQKKVSVIEERFLNHVITQNRLQLASTYGTDSVTFKVDYANRLAGVQSLSVQNVSVEENYNNDLYNLILKNILVGKDNYDYDTMCTMLLDYASWSQITWDQYDELMTIVDEQQNPIEELPEEAPVL